MLLEQILGSWTELCALEVKVDAKVTPFPSRACHELSIYSRTVKHRSVCQAGSFTE